MELRVKNGYVLVLPVDQSSYDLNGIFRAGKIAVGAAQDLDTVVFFSEYDSFAGEYLLVKIEDINVWVAPEVKAEVAADEPKNDQVLL